MVAVEKGPAVPFGLRQDSKNGMWCGQALRSRTRHFGKSLDGTAPVHRERVGIECEARGIGAEVQVPYPAHRQVEGKNLQDSTGRADGHLKGGASEDGIVRHGKVHQHLVRCHPPPETLCAGAHPLDSPRQLGKDVGVGEAPTPCKGTSCRIHP